MFSPNIGALIIEIGFGGGGGVYSTITLTRKLPGSIHYSQLLRPLYY